MHFSRPVAFFAALLLCGSGSLRAQVPSASAVPVDSVQLEGVNVQTVEPDKALLIAHVTVTAQRSLNVQSFSFSAMRVNGMPVYVAPLQGKFILRKGEPFKLPDMQITVYFRDLSTLAPLRNVVDQQKVRISGETAAAIDANLLEKLALHSLHPSIVIPFSKEIPVTVPGGEVGRHAALVTIDMVSQLTPAAGRLLGVVFPGADADWRNDLNTNQVRHLLLIHTDYTIVTDNGSFQLGSTQLGFWIGPATALVPAEAIKPWEFDPDAGARLAEGHSRVDKNSIMVTVRPVALASDTATMSPNAASISWTLANGDFKIEFEGKPPADRVDYAAGLKSSSIVHRASPSNYALLRFRDGIAGDPVMMATPQNGTDHFGVFHMVRNHDGNIVGTEVVVLPGLNDGHEIRFEQPIDDSGFGSPVFSKDGAIAILQDESQATLLTSIQHLDSKPNK